MMLIKIHDNRNDDDGPVFESTDEQEIIDWFDNVYPEFREFYCHGRKHRVPAFCVPQAECTGGTDR